MISGQLLAAFEMDASTDRVVLKMKGYDDLILDHHGGLASARGKVDFILTRFVEKLALPRITLDSLADAVSWLDDQMGQIALMLVDGNSDLLDEIRVRFVNAWPQWQIATDVVPLVEIRGHDDEFPFELLPLFDATGIEDFMNYAEAEDALRRFLGFGAAVRRSRGERVEVENLHASPKLPVQFLSYTMHGVEAEGRYFDGSLDRINIEGPWPKPTLKQDRVVERLVNALYNPAKSLNGRARRGTPVQVQHFACHCRTINQTDAGYTLVLGGPDERERNVTLGAIRRGFRRRTQRGRVAGARPLIIANACGSAKIDKETRQSFPHWFLSNRFRGFVGTETDVPDDVAADFAARLYQELFDKKPLGEAVVMARRRLMSERGSPLGLLYVLYGNPALAIEEAVSDD